MLKEGAGSQRQVDEAEAAHSLASKTLDAAITRQTILKKVMGDADSGSVTSIPIVAPSDGVLRTISARKGQSVPSGALLFEILDTSIVWIKVPLPNGDLDSATSAATAEVGKLSAANLSAPVTAKKVAAPPSGNLLSSSVDVFYELANKDGKLIPGQRLGVTIPLGESKTRLFVPWSSIVIDIHGNSWVYEELSSRKYVRRRVLVEYTLGHDAVLASGPGEGAKIVMTGAMELFGAETGFVK